MDRTSLQENDLHEVSRICARHRIEIKTLALIIGSFDKRIFFINDDLLLRVSAVSMAAEQAKFRQVSALDFVPKILHVGVLEHEPHPLHYTLLTCLPGDDFANVYAQTTLA